MRMPFCNQKGNYDLTKLSIKTTKEKQAKRQKAETSEDASENKHTKNKIKKE